MSVRASAIPRGMRAYRMPNCSSVMRFGTRSTTCSLTSPCVAIVDGVDYRRSGMSGAR